MAAEKQAALLAPVFFQFRGGFERRRVDGDDFQFRATGSTVDDLSDFDVVVQGYFRPTLRAVTHTGLSRLADDFKGLIRLSRPTVEVFDRGQRGYAFATLGLDSPVRRGRP